MMLVPSGQPASSTVPGTPPSKWSFAPLSAPRSREKMSSRETEKVEVYRLAEKLGGDIEAAIRQLAERRRNKE